LGCVGLDANETFAYPACIGEGAIRITHVVTALSLLLVPVLGLAISQVDDVTRIPEPETLVLLAAGGIAWAIARWTKRK